MRRLVGTDLYYRCYKVPNDICLSYRFIEKDTLSGTTNHHLDAFNPDRIPTGEKKELSYSVIDLKKSKAQLYARLPDNPTGRVKNFKFNDRVINRGRKIYVYLPPGYDQHRKKAYPVIYLFDSPIYLNRVEVPHIIDNLIARKAIEPMVAVMIASYKRTRGKVLPLNFDFMKMFISEIVPFIRSKREKDACAIGLVTRMLML